ncbi:MAG: hypothetical protein J0L61_04095 [Planctomycetes bacterium]|nr:hypothetical protein [Planctomycetota bacterium]
MFLNVFVIVCIGLSALLWGSKQKGRGLFSAFLHLACVFAAGAIALGLWEPLVYGFLLKSMPDYAWTVGLIGPFVLALVILRVAVDVAVPKNLDFDDTTNFIGGALFGGLSGLVAAGIVVLGVSHLRSGKELLGYTPLVYKGGSLVSEKSLWVPADKLVLGAYEKLSLASFSTDTPLAERQPRAWEAAAMARTVVTGSGENQGNRGRTTILPEDVSIKGRYAVGPAPADAVLSDSFIPGPDGKPSKAAYTDPTGSTPSGEAELHGFVLNFSSGASEKSGQVVIGPGQVRLVCSSPEGPVAVHPAAIVARPEAGQGMYRFRMDAPDIFIGSVGGGSNAVFAVEFVVPKGATPTDLYIKGTRFDPGALDEKNRFANTTRRDDAVRDGSLFDRFGLGVGGSKPAPSGGQSSGTQTPTPAGGKPGASSGAPAPAATGTVVATGGRNTEIEQSSLLPDNYIINAGELGGLEVNSDRRIVDGEHQFERTALQNNRGIDRNLRVEQFAPTRDTAVVQLLLSRDGAMSTLGRSIEAAEDILPPTIIDAEGNRYEAIGYIYAEGNIVRIRYTPGKPLRGLSELPSRVSRSKRDQSVRLIFRPTAKVKITEFALGQKTISRFEPPLETTR